MTLCMWVTLTEDHLGTWHLLATKWNDANAHFAWHFGIEGEHISSVLASIAAYGTMT
eukprot:SAG11_NODE_38169_length_253_cov_1.084416_1_plen_56_part_10